MCESIRQVALRGLTAPHKTLPCRLFYDDAGAALFDRICETPEYYPTRTEAGILTEHIDEIGSLIGPNARLVEPGSGSASKTRILLRRIQLAEYVPLDISRQQLCDTARALTHEFTSLRVNPLCVDYTTPWCLPAAAPHVARTVIFFPGSTIGNFAPADAIAFLRCLADAAGRNGGLLIGVDLHKDRARLESAYNDMDGTTAAFNLNILTRLNREAGANFRPTAFFHEATYDERLHRIEMRLVSAREQKVTFSSTDGMPDAVIGFRRDEFIVTEHSYKHSVEGFDALVARAGWVRRLTWIDTDRLFAVHWCDAQPA